MDIEENLDTVQRWFYPLTSVWIAMIHTSALSHGLSGSAGLALVHISILFTLHGNVAPQSRHWHFLIPSITTNWSNTQGFFVKNWQKTSCGSFLYLYGALS